ncbi:molecular chaperone DnaJ [Chloroflexota bacterium]
MAAKRDYYEILGIVRDSTDETIKKAFRKLAFQYHPDRNRDDGAEGKFKEVNEAYEVLSDPDKRAAYDRFGHSGAEGVFGRGFEGFNFGGFGDIFDAFFGGSASATRQAPQRGPDLHYGVAITFEETAFGCEKEVTILRTENCSMCRGIGCKPDTQPTRCPNCNGSGQVRRIQQSIFGRFTSTTACSQCHGEGRIVTDPCPQCKGSGREKRKSVISVKIPAGVDNDTQIRLAGEGESGLRGGSAGNLYITLSVLSHQIFTRSGDDIIYELPLNFAEAALGAELIVPTLDGENKLKIPAGCQMGKVFRLKNKGIPHLHHNGRGDQLVNVRVVTPDKLTKEQKQLFRQLSDSLDAVKGKK